MQAIILPKLSPLSTTGERLSLDYGKIYGCSGTWASRACPDLLTQESGNGVRFVAIG